MVPPIKEAQKLLQAFVKNVAESSRSFVRWMDGTCLEMPDQRPKGDTDGDPLVMHFSSEVIRMQQVRVGPQCLPLLKCKASMSMSRQPAQHCQACGPCG